MPDNNDFVKLDIQLSGLEWILGSRGLRFGVFRWLLAPAIGFRLGGIRSGLGDFLAYCIFWCLAFTWAGKFRWYTAFLLGLWQALFVNAQLIVRWLKVVVFKSSRDFLARGSCFGVLLFLLSPFLSIWTGFLLVSIERSHSIVLARLFSRIGLVGSEQWQDLALIGLWVFISAALFPFIALLVGALVFIYRHGFFKGRRAFEKRVNRTPFQIWMVWYANLLFSLPLAAFVWIFISPLAQEVGDSQVVLAVTMSTLQVVSYTPIRFGVWIISWSLVNVLLILSGLVVCQASFSL